MTICLTQYQKHFDKKLKTQTKKEYDCTPFLWRIDWGSNPGYAINIHTSSNRAPSTTQPSIHVEIYYIQKTGFVNSKYFFDYNQQSNQSNIILNAIVYNIKSTRMGAFLFSLLIVV